MKATAVDTIDTSMRSSVLEINMEVSFRKKGCVPIIRERTSTVWFDIDGSRTMIKVPPMALSLGEGERLLQNGLSVDPVDGHWIGTPSWYVDRNGVAVQPTQASNAPTGDELSPALGGQWAASRVFAMRVGAIHPDLWIRWVKWYEPAAPTLLAMDSLPCVPVQVGRSQTVCGRDLVDRDCIELTRPDGDVALVDSRYIRWLEGCDLFQASNGRIPTESVVLAKKGGELVALVAPIQDSTR